MQINQDQQIEAKSWLRWVVYLLIIVSILGYFFAFKASRSEALRWSALFVPLALAGVAWMFSPNGERFKKYLRSTKQEAEKVVWPSGKETWQMGLVVLAFVIIITLFVWFSDHLATWVFYDLLLHRKSL
jgi:preprotein translocase subunit SecE